MEPTGRKLYVAAKAHALVESIELHRTDDENVFRLSVGGVITGLTVRVAELNLNTRNDWFSGGHVLDLRLVAPVMELPEITATGGARE